MLRRPSFLTILMCWALTMMAALASEREAAMESLKYDIERNLIGVLNQVMPPAKFAEQHEEYTLPVLPPTAALEEVEQMIQDELQRVLDEKYPESRRAEIVNQAEELFRLYKKGERVTIRARKQGPEPKEITGTLYAISRNNIRIGDQIIPMADIVSQDQAHFLRDVQDGYIKRFIKVQTQQFERQRARFEEEQRPLISGLMYKQNGYMARDGQWHPARTLFLADYERQREELYKQYYPKEEAEVLQTDGWYYDEGKTEWTKADHAGGAVAAGESSAPRPPAPKSSMEEARPILTEIVQSLYGTEGPGSKPAGGGLLDLPSDRAPVQEPPAEAPAAAPPAGDVSDLYDED